MAAAYLEKRLKDLGKEGITVASAGIAPFPGMKATKEAQQVLKAEGVDISSHAAKKITDVAIREADLIFVMEDVQRRYLLSRDPQTAKKTYLLKDFKKIGHPDVSDNSDIADPIGKNIDFYKKTFAVIKEAIEKIIEEIDGKKD